MSTSKPKTAAEVFHDNALEFLLQLSQPKVELQTVMNSFKALPAEVQQTSFAEVLAWDMNSEGRAWRQVNLLFAFGEKLTWRQPQTFMVLKQFWTHFEYRLGFAAQILACLRELTVTPQT